MREKTLPSDHVSYLNDRIHGWFWKDSFSTCTLNIETQYPERRNLRPVAFRCMRNDVVISSRISKQYGRIMDLLPNSNLQLTMRPSVVCTGDSVFTGWYFDPVHSDDL